MTEYEYFSPENIWRMTYKLGKMIKKEFNPDILIGISRGGLCVVRVLSDFLNNPNVFIIRAKYYKGIGSTAKELEILQDIDGKIIRGKKVLVVDEIADTGINLDAVIRNIKNKGIAELKSATIHYKPWSKIKPDYFIEETEKWTIYPWMVNETVIELKQKLSGNALEKELKRTGIPEEMYKQFL